MRFTSLFRTASSDRDTGEEPAALHVGAIVRQARQPVFYTELSVPDTFDGRFDLVALHAALVLGRLKGQGPDADHLSRRVQERLVVAFDDSLREMGVGDTGIGRHVRTAARALSGRFVAYDRALRDGSARAVEIALENNLYGTVSAVAPAVLVRVAAYVRESAARLGAVPMAGLLGGQSAFADLSRRPSPTEDRLP